MVASSVRSHFFDFHKSAEKLCASWVLPLIECVAVWTLKLPVPHTDALKTHVSQSFSADLLEFQKTSNDYLMRPNPPAKLRKKCCPTAAPPRAKKEVHLSRDKLNFFFNFGIFYGSPFVQNCCISVCTQLPVPPFSLV